MFIPTAANMPRMYDRSSTLVPAPTAHNATSRRGLFGLLPWYTFSNRYSKKQIDPCCLPIVPRIRTNNACSYQIEVARMPPHAHLAPNTHKLSCVTTFGNNESQHCEQTTSPLQDEEHMSDNDSSVRRTYTGSDNGWHEFGITDVHVLVYREHKRSITHNTQSPLMHAVASDHCQCEQGSFQRRRPMKSQDSPT